MKSLQTLTACSLLFTASLLNAADAEQYIKDAEAYLEKGEAKSAVIQLKNALQENPASIEARLMLGKIYLKAGDGASAEKEFGRAKKLNAPKNLWELDLAKSYLLQRKFQEILDGTTEDSTAPTDHQLTVLLLRGDAYLGLRQNNKSREAFAKAAVVDNESQDALIGLVMVDLSENNVTAASDGLDKIISRFPENITALVIRGEINSQQRSFDRAMVDFNTAIALQPKNPRALLGRANINLSKGKIDDTKKDLEIVATTIPGHPKLLNMSGAIALLEKDLDKAETLFQQSLKISPNNVQTQAMLGTTHFYKGNHETAHELLTEVLKAAPKMLPAIKLLASIKHKLQQSDEVVSLLEPALRDHPDDPQLMAMLGSAYMQVKRFDEGSNLMSRAIEISPDLAAYRTQLALGLLAQGKTGAAIQELESTIEMDKDFVQADVLLVLSHLSKKDYSNALKASEALEKQSPNNPVGFNLSGLAYLMEGSTEKAEKSFKHAIKLDPNFITAEINLARMSVQKGDLKQAKQYYENTLKKSPKNSTILMGLADLAGREGNNDEMHALLERAHNGEPKSSRPGLFSAQTYLKQGTPLKALRITSQLITSFPNEPAVMVIHGRTQLATGDAINAVTTFRHLSEKVKNAETLHMLGNAQQAAGLLDDARSSYKEALKEKADYAPALIGQFGLEIGAGNFELASSHAQSIQKTLPDQAIGYEFEGTAYAFQNKTQQAIPLYEKAFQIQASEKVAILLASQYEKAGNPAKGLTFIRDWISKHPEQTQPQLSLSMMLLSQGKHDESIVEYEKVLTTDKDNLIALNNLAWLYSTKGDKRASQLGKRAYELAPTRPEIIDTYGWILVQEGDYKTGSQILKQAAELAPKNQEIVYHLGYSLNKHGETQQAKAILKRAIDISKDSDLAKLAQKLLSDIQ